MKEVVLLAPTPPPFGGIASWTVRMMNSELPNEWQLKVVDEKIIGNREFFGGKNKHNIINEIKRCYKIWKELYTSLKNKNTKVVHSCIPANTLPVIREIICALITKFLKKKFVIHYRCTVNNMVKNYINKIVVKLLCDISDCVILLNSTSVKFIERLSNTKTVLIPNFVSKNEICNKYIVKDIISRVIYIGGVIENKGCIDIIEIAKRFPKIEFRLIGKPDDKCKEASKNIKNVILTGPKDHTHIKEEMVEADLFIFLSYFNGEGFSNALVEAMASGLPCIVTDWAANRDMIEDKGGIVVPIKDTEECINAFIKMMPKMTRVACSNFNINKVKNKYIDEIVLKSYTDVYDSLI